MWRSIQLITSAVNPIVPSMINKAESTVLCGNRPTIAVPLATIRI